MPDPRLEVLIPRDKVAARVQEMGAELHARLQNEDNVLLVALLRGAVFFFVDLVRAMGSPNVRFELIRASSYADDQSDSGAATVSTGKVKVDEKALVACEGRRVVLIDDIVDTGLTLNTLHQHMLDRGAIEVIAATLLDKKERREVEYQPEFVGFEIPNHFVVGYGLDCAGEYRTLADICIFHPEG